MVRGFQSSARSRDIGAGDECLGDRAVGRHRAVAVVRLAPPSDPQRNRDPPETEGGPRFVEVDTAGSFMIEILLEGAASLPDAARSNPGRYFSCVHGAQNGKLPGNIAVWHLWVN